MSNQGGGGAKCVNLFLFVATIMFIIDSNIQISELKAENDSLKQELRELRSGKRKPPPPSGAGKENGKRAAVRAS